MDHERIIHILDYLSRHTDESHFVTINHENLTIGYLIAPAVMIAGTAFVVSDTMKQK